MTDSRAVIPFKDATKLIKKYSGSREDVYLLVRDVDRAMSRIRPEDKDYLLDYVISQLEKDESEMIANKTFRTWEELREYLSGSFQKLGELNLGREIAKFSTLKQGETEDIHSYYERAYKFKRRIDIIEDKPGHEQYPLLKQTNQELIRNFVFGLRNEQFRFTLSQKLPETMREVLDQVEKWEQIPGCTPKSKFSNSIMAIEGDKKDCPLCDTNSHNLAQCPEVMDAQRQSNHQEYQMGARQPYFHGGLQGDDFYQRCDFKQRGGLNPHEGFNQRGGYSHRGGYQGYGREDYNQNYSHRFNQTGPRQYSYDQGMGNRNWQRNDGRNYGRGPAQPAGWNNRNDGQGRVMNDYNQNYCEGYPRPETRYYDYDHGRNIGNWQWIDNRNNFGEGTGQRSGLYTRDRGQRVPMGYGFENRPNFKGNNYYGNQQQMNHKPAQGQYPPSGEFKKTLDGQGPDVKTESKLQPKISSFGNTQNFDGGFDSDEQEIPFVEFNSLIAEGMDYDYGEDLFENGPPVIAFVNKLRFKGQARTRRPRRAKSSTRGSSPDGRNRKGKGKKVKDKTVQTTQIWEVLQQIETLIQVLLNRMRDSHALVG